MVSDNETKSLLIIMFSSSSLITIKEWDLGMYLTYFLTIMQGYY